MLDKFKLERGEEYINKLLNSFKKIEKNEKNKEIEEKEQPKPKEVENKDQK